MKVHKVLYLLFFLSAFTHVLCKENRDFGVFKKWMEIQEVFLDVNFVDHKKNLNNDFLYRFKSEYEKSFLLFKHINPFLSVLTHNQITTQGYQLQPSFMPELKETFEQLYDMIENDLQQFVDFCHSNFVHVDDFNPTEKKEYDFVIDQHKALARLLFNDEYKYREDQKIFAFANRLFEYCFSDATCHHFRNIMVNKSSLPLARFIFSTLWYHLVGNGWKCWHENTLKTLKEKADEGYRVVYIAGGNDLYQLLRRGIYNITVIDPFLPTQDRYYAHGWQWLVQKSDETNGLGDTVVCTFDHKKILLRRTFFNQAGTGCVKLSDEKIHTTEKSITEWTVHDDATDEVLGTVIFDRRFTIQDDFLKQDKIVLLMSYDEMVYAVVPEHLNGWGINPSALGDDVELLIKQLRKPVSKQHLQNIRVTSMMNFAYLNYINLASDPQ